ncbi:MAG TPA: LytTR family DNA-binding domain-containing protein [Saprospiraceae bacterium]|nr:LytTR family DNA-binding domain-containing protein [Saprospiraceae bacterium]
MKSIRSILVDDEPRGLTSLAKLLQLNCPEVEVISCCTSADDAKTKIAELNPDLVFLDVAMPGRNGFDLLSEMKEINFEIIFVTAYNTYMTQAFRYSAVDYLLKPVEDELLIESVKRAAKRIGQRTETAQVDTFLYNVQHSGNPQKLKLCIHSLKGFQVVEIKDIVYCEASSNYTNFHFVNRSIICASKPIHEYESLLEDSQFVRIHKSYLVNIEYIKEYIRGEGGSVLLAGGQEVEVSRRKKEVLMRKMKEHYKY